MCFASQLHILSRFASRWENHLEFLNMIKTDFVHYRQNMNMDIVKIVHFRTDLLQWSKILKVFFSGGYKRVGQYSCPVGIRDIIMYRKSNAGRRRRLSDDRSSVAEAKLCHINIFEKKKIFGQESTKDGEKLASN